MDKKVKILVIGQSGDGKSTILQLIQDKLKEQGFDSAVVVDRDVPPRENLAARVEHLKDRVKLEIMTVDLPRR